jgi:branched-chain amino acid transport system ATP-binding protein
MLDVTGLESRYGRIPVLHGIDLAVRAGELVALVGGNGAGKTTLLRALSGVQPSKGRVIFEDEDISSASAEHRVNLGIVQCPEGRQVFGPLSVEDNLRLGAYRRGGAHAPETLGRVYALFPPPRRAPPPGRGHALGRAAADARHRPGPDGAAAPALAG